MRDYRGAKQTVFRVLLPACLLVTLAACGFQLRGSASLPGEMAVTFIAGGKPYDSLHDDFAEALRARQVKVTDVRSEATAVLNILKNSRDKEVLSVNTAGKVLEFQLSQSIRFSVETTDKIPLLEPQGVSLSRDYLYSSTDVLSKKREEAVVRRTMQRELVNLAMLRITAAAGQ